MSNLSIYEKKWLDLVFEGRNQSYGAYQLRIQNPRTTILSLILGALLFIGALGGLVLAKNSYELSQAPILPLDFVVKVDEWNPPIPPKPEKEILAASSSREKENTEQRLINPEIVPNTDNPIDVMTNVEAARPTQSNATGETGQRSANNLGNTAVDIPGNASENAAVITATLDKLPEFPGGIEKFLNYVGHNFREPDLSNSRLNSSKVISVIVSFVIEKDGSMTDIKVLRDPGYKLGDEAIRVLKSQKTKWKPGIKDGKPVRTLYTLPISIVPQ